MDKELWGLRGVLLCDAPTVSDLRAALLPGRMALSPALHGKGMNVFGFTLSRCVNESVYLAAAGKCGGSKAAF